MNFQGHFQKPITGTGHPYKGGCPCPYLFWCPFVLQMSLKMSLKCPYEKATKISHRPVPETRSKSQPMLPFFKPDPRS